jgi:hypothetical protein
MQSEGEQWYAMKLQREAAEARGPIPRRPRKPWAGDNFLLTAAGIVGVFTVLGFIACGIWLVVEVTSQ